MSMQFNGSVHAEGWWDHMPTGHLRNVPMNNGAVDRESNTPYRHEKSGRQRSHTAGWVLLFVVAAGGLSMAAAHQLDPAGFDAKVDAVVASAHDLGDKIADQFDNKQPAVNVDVTALATPSATTSEQAAAPAATASAVQPQPQAQPQPQPQQMIQQHPTGAGPAVKPAPEPVSTTTLAPPMAVTTLPLQPPPAQQTQMQQAQPVTPIAPVTPVSPVTTAPPIPPATQAPPATQTPPPPPPTQGPQSEQSSL